MEEQKTTIQVDSIVWKELMALKNIGENFNDVLKRVLLQYPESYNLNKKEITKDGKDNNLANVEIEKSNIRSKTKIHDNVKTKAEQNGGSEELPEPVILNEND